MIEKRVMMKFVQSCTKTNQANEFDFSELIDSETLNKNIPFKEFIQSKKLPPLVCKYLIDAVAMCPTNPTYTTLEV